MVISRGGRIPVAVCVVLAAVAAVLWQVDRVRINLAKKEIEQSTASALLMPPSRAANAARGNLARLAPLLRRNPVDVDLWLEAGANQRLLRQWEEAIESYTRALRIEPRPEVYLNLGHAEVQAGRIEGAIDHYARAVRFWESNVASVPIEWKLVYDRVETLRAEEGSSNAR
jgi:tetratricopeptide (TPR) repeat protein